MQTSVIEGKPAWGRGRGRNIKSQLGRWGFFQDFQRDGIFYPLGFHVKRCVRLGRPSYPVFFNGLLKVKLLGCT